MILFEGKVSIGSGKQTQAAAKVILFEGEV
jgi:hypothetical protein